MLTPYANQATKQIVVSLAGAKGFTETLLETEAYRNKEKADEFLKVAKENLQLAINAVCEGLNLDQYNGLMRFAGNSTLSVVPKLSPYSGKQEFVVSWESLEAILQSSTGACAFCDKGDEEAKKCKIKKALLDSQVIPAGSNAECPFKM